MLESAFKIGDRVVVTQIVYTMGSDVSMDPYIGLTGTVIRTGGTYVDVEFNMDERKLFRDVELELAEVA